MKTIGLLGGMSWESTVSYYQTINRYVSQRLGSFHSAKILLNSVDFAPIEKAQREDRWDDAGQVVADAARDLERGGADFLVIGCNTMHRAADQIESVRSTSRSSTSLTLLRMKSLPVEWSASVFSALDLRSRRTSFGVVSNDEVAVDDPVAGVQLDRNTARYGSVLAGEKVVVLFIGVGADVTSRDDPKHTVFVEWNIPLNVADTAFQHIRLQSLKRRKRRRIHVTMPMSGAVVACRAAHECHKADGGIGAVDELSADPECVLVETHSAASDRFTRSDDKQKRAPDVHPGLFCFLPPGVLAALLSRY